MDEVKVEEDEFSVEVLVISVGEVLGDAFEGDDESDDLQENACINKRLRTFHIV